MRELTKQNIQQMISYQIERVIIKKKKKDI